jgi:energy-coupling factor transporter ATP-binding protein EcfA2
VKIDLLENRRHLLVGATGSGKTHLGRALISNSPKYPVIIFDTKIDDAFESIPNSVIIDGLDLSQANWRYPVQIFRPLGHEYEPKILDDFLEEVYLQGDCTLWIDEVTQVTGGRVIPGIGFLDVCTRGRQKKITTIFGTQRPRGIPSVVLTESEVFYVFKLTSPEDRKRIVDYTGYNAFQEILPDRWFRYFRQGRPPVLMSPLGDYPVAIPKPLPKIVFA